MNSSDSLEAWLEASLCGQVVSKYALPTDAELTQVHAQREYVRVPVLPYPTEEQHAR